MNATHWTVSRWYIDWARTKSGFLAWFTNILIVFGPFSTNRSEFDKDKLHHWPTWGVKPHRNRPSKSRILAGYQILDFTWSCIFKILRTFTLFEKTTATKVQSTLNFSGQQLTFSSCCLVTLEFFNVCVELITVTLPLTAWQCCSWIDNHNSAIDCLQ